MKNIIATYLIPLVLLASSCGSETAVETEFEVLIKNNQHEQALDYWRQHPEEKYKGNSLLELGKYYNERVNFDVSGEIFRSLIEQDPENSIAQLLLANNYRETKGYNAAINIYNKLVDIDSLRIFVLPERARLYVLLNEFDKAEQDIGIARSIEANYFAVFLADGLLKFAEGKNEVALDMFERAEDLDPGVSSEAALYAGVMLLNMGINLDALGKFTSAIETGKNINMGYAYINRGISQINLLDTAFACDDWEMAKNYMPEEAESYITQFCK